MMFNKTIELKTKEELCVPTFDEYIFKKKMNKYCLLIPIFNEILNFPLQIENMKIHNVFKIIDVIVCDAGSTDGSTDVEKLKESGFTALLIRKGKGRYSTDLRMGYSWALKQGYLGMITVDGTNRDGTEAIPLFLQKMDAGYGYVQGSRFIKGGRAVNTPLFRTICIRAIADPLISIGAHRCLSDTTNGFRAYSRQVMEDERIKVFRDIFNLHELFYYLPVRVSRLGYKITTVPVERIYPKKGDISTHSTILSGLLTILALLRCIFGYYNPKIQKVRR